MVDFAINGLGIISVVQAAVPVLGELKRSHIVAASLLAGRRTPPLVGIYHATAIARRR